MRFSCLNPCQEDFGRQGERKNSQMEARAGPSLQAQGCGHLLGLFWLKGRYMVSADLELAGSFL